MSTSSASEIPSSPRRGSPAAPSPQARWYLPVAAKFWISVTFGIVWLAGSIWLSLPWLHDLSGYVGPVGAIVAVTLVAYIPALLMAFMAMSLLLDRQPQLRVSQSNYRRDDRDRGAERGSRDRRDRSFGGADRLRRDRSRSCWPTTARPTRRAPSPQRVATALGVELVIVHEPKPGKANALNHALRMVDTPYVVTVDADTLLHRQALRRLVARLESAPADTVAVAGAVMIRNSRANLLTRMQEWDYFLGIAAVKRMQGLYQSTLVAQGAFSLYRTDELRRVGGWPDAIGEDIVVTWRLMETGDRGVDRTDGDRVHRRAHAGLALHAPARPVGPRHGRGDPHRPAVAAAAGCSRVSSPGIDLLIPLLDIGYGLIWVPGLVLAAFGFPIIVGTWTLAVLPITLLVYGGLRRYQRRRIFSPLHLKVRHNVARVRRVHPRLPVAVLGGFAGRATRRRSAAPAAAGSTPVPSIGVPRPAHPLRPASRPRHRSARVARSRQESRRLGLRHALRRRPSRRRRPRRSRR